MTNELPNVAPIAPVERGANPTFGTAFQGLMRLTWSGLMAWRRLPGVLALILANPTLAALALSTAQDHREAGLRLWVLHLYAHFMVPIACLLSGGSMIRDEIQSGTLPFLVTRPVSRARLYVLMYLCHVAWLELALALNAGLLTLVGVGLGIPGALKLGLWLMWVQVLVIPAFTAVSAVLGLASKRYVLLGILYGGIVEAGFGQIPTNINVLSISRHFAALMGQCPGLEATVPLSGWGMPGTLLELAVLTGIALGLGVVLISMREFLEDEAPR